MPRLQNGLCASCRLQIEPLESRRMLAGQPAGDVISTPFRDAFNPYHSSFHVFGDYVAYNAANPTRQNGGTWIATGDSDEDAVLRTDFYAPFNPSAVDDRLHFIARRRPPDASLVAMWSLDSAEGELDLFANVSHGFDQLWIGTNAIFGSVRRFEFEAKKGDGDFERLRFGQFDYPTLVGSTLFFVRFTLDMGEELWASDGTRDGTTLFADLVEGRRGSEPKDLYQFNDQLVFAAGHPFIIGSELWASDGTPEGTRLVRDINVGPTGSKPSDFTTVGEFVYFAANDGIHGNELWRSDGSTAGTTLVTDVATGATNSNPRSITLAGDTLFFIADNEEGPALFKHELGSPEATLVSTFPTAVDTVDPEQLTAAGDRVYFTIEDETLGRELWTSDGTADGTHVVLDIASGANSSDPNRLTTYGDRLLFFAEDETYGLQIWISDGTADGTNIFSVRQTRYPNIDEMTRTMATAAYDPTFDLDVNGILDRRDIDAWLSFAGKLTVSQEFAYGDVNLDGLVDMCDLETIQENLFRDGTSWTTGDLNADGVTDVADFNIWNDAASATEAIRDSNDHRQGIRSNRRVARRDQQILSRRALADYRLRANWDNLDAYFENLSDTDRSTRSPNA